MSQGFFRQLLRHAVVFDIKQRIVTRGFRAMQENFSSFFDMNGASNLRILDVGCGTGLCAKMMFGDGNNIVVGLDSNKDYVKFAQTLYSDLHFVCGDANNLPFANAAFDLIFLSSVLHHLPDSVSHQLFRSLRGILKEGGKVLVSEPVWSNRKLSNALLRHDRGQFVKNNQEYVALIEETFLVTNTFQYRYAATEFLGAVAIHRTST